MDIIDIKPVDLQTLSMQALQPLHDALDSGLNGKQRELAEIIFIGLINSAAAQTCTPDILAKTAMAVFVQVSHDLGGQQFYVSKMDNLLRDQMNHAIRAGFNGRNHAQLARKHGISDARVRQILNPQPRNRK